MQSVQNMLLFTIWSSPLEIVEISLHALTAKIMPIFFVMKWEFMNKSWTFYPPIPAVLRIYCSTSGKPGLITEKHELCIIYTLKKPIKKCILATRECSFEAWTTNILHSCSCDMSVALYPDIFKTLVSWTEKFSATFSSKLIFEMQHVRHKNAFQQCIWVEALHHWRAEMHLPAINLTIHRACLLSLTVEVTLQFENSTQRAYLAT